MPSNTTVRPSRKRPKSRFLRELGIVGWDHLEPVILASLATESPLLLIGRHGCGEDARPDAPGRGARHRAPALQRVAAEFR